jgi:hypothetical protein
MRNGLRNSVVIMGITVTFAVARPSVAAAETFHCANEDVACLIFAINDANSDTHEKSTIWLEAGGTYTVTTVDNDTDGPNGLPSITGNLTIRVTGKGTATLTRATDVNTPDFRLLHVAATSHFTLRGLVVSNGRVSTPDHGAGLFNSGGEVIIAQSTFASNTAVDGSGGGLFNNGGVVTIRKSTFDGNNAQVGGSGLLNHGQMTIIDSTFDRNRAFADGALFNDGTLSIVRSQITNNNAAFDAGGLYVADGSMEIRNSTFSGNSSQGAGAIEVAHGTVIISDSAFLRNVGASGGVSAISNFAGPVSVTNTTFAYATGGACCGSVVIFNSATLSLTSSTFFENAQGSGGIVIESATGATTVLENTILAHDADDGVSDCRGLITSRGNNIIGDPAGCDITLRPGDLTGDPGLDLFTDDGKPGHGHFPLLPTSPAIGAGNPAVCPRDDELDHPRHGRCDIGAIEFRPGPGK